MCHVNLQRWQKSSGLTPACHAQSWLVSLFLDCPPNMGFVCPSDTAKRVRSTIFFRIFCTRRAASLLISEVIGCIHCMLH